jgi:hypothetical protein
MAPAATFAHCGLLDRDEFEHRNRHRTHAIAAQHDREHEFGSMR